MTLFTRTDPITAAARKFNDAMNELIILTEENYPNNHMIPIAKRKLNFVYRTDIVLPVKLCWESGIITKEHGMAIVNRDDQYFINVPHIEHLKLAESRNDVNANDIQIMLTKFRQNWSSDFSDVTKDRIWKSVQKLYSAFIDYGLAIKQSGKGKTK